MKRVLGIVLVVLAVLIWPAFRRHSPISRRLVAGGIGIDQTNERIDLSVQALGDTSTVVSIGGDTVADAIASSARVVGQDLELRQNRLFCVGEKTVKTLSLMSLTDYLVRSGNGRLTADVVIGRGEAKGLLKTVSVEQMTAVTQLSATTGQGMRCRLLDLERALDENGDVLIPIVRAENGEALLDGAALFHGGSCVKELSASQTNHVAVARGNAQTITVTCRTGPDSVTAKLDGWHRAVTVTKSGDRLRFQLTFTARAALLENNASDVEQRLQEQLTQYVNEAIDQTAKACGSDVLGLQDEIKKQMPFAASAVKGEWEQHLKSAEYVVSVSVSVTETGLRD